MRRLFFVLALLASLLLSGCSDRSMALRIRDVSRDAGPVDVAARDVWDAPEVAVVPDSLGDVALCRAVPPPAALTPAGPQDDGSLITPGGRRTAATGISTDLVGFPSKVVLHPDGLVAYVASVSHDDRRLFVVDLETVEVLQDIDRGESYRGLVVSPEGRRLYAGGGESGRIEWFDVAADGSLSFVDSVEVGGYVSDLALSADGSTLWAGMLDTGVVVEIDTVDMTQSRSMVAGTLTWEILPIESLGELWVSDLRGELVSVLDLTSGERVEEIALPTSPAGMAVDRAGSVVWVAVSGADRVAAVDTESRVPIAWGTVGEEDFVDPDGVPLGNSNPNALAFDANEGRLYVGRGADNAVTVLDAEDLGFVGSLPTRWYPTDVALTGDASTLVVLSGKGAGAGPSRGEGVKQNLTGSVTLVDLSSLDLAVSTEEVKRNYARPQDVFPFDCAGDFPLPSRPGQVSPIEHVILIVKENKTFDCVLGDLDDIDAEVDPELLRWGQEITPNIHALAREFALSDNFYTEVPNSDVGHVMLTSAHLTEYVERIWKEDSRTGINPAFPVDDASVPDVGNFFTHLLDHEVDLRIYGEIVGMFATADNGQSPMQYSDMSYPGGPATTYKVKDEDKARYVAGRIEAGELASFTYLLLPNDHTEGTNPGSPTPESMVADNDYAVGIVVDALSKSTFWDKSVVFILQDDPQGCEDHVDGHRSIFVAAGPWVRRNYVSHVHTSFMSVFATMERILGVPPMGRPDASVSPMWDIFSPVADTTPYEAIERLVPEDFNTKDLPGSKASAAMDFRSPDRNLYLGIVLDSYRLWRMGRLSKEEADQRIADPELSDEELRELVEEREEETLAFDRDWVRYQHWLARRR